MTNELTPENALIFRITHIDNVPSILENGLCCRNSENYPGYHEIGNPDLIDRRADRVVPVFPQGNLSDYIPFYFTPFSPMLLNIKTGHNNITQRPMSEIVILVSSLHTLLAQRHGFLFTDRHAVIGYARFYNDLNDLGQIDWRALQARDFRRDPQNPEKMERYQAEVLVYQHLPVQVLDKVICYDSEAEGKVRSWMKTSGIGVNVVTAREWYF